MSSSIFQDKLFLHGHYQADPHLAPQGQSYLPQEYTLGQPKKEHGGHLVPIKESLSLPD